LIPASAIAQLSGDELLREKFNLETVQIDEFIQRFNFDSKTKVLKYLKETRPEYEIDREDLLRYLFDQNSFNRSNSGLNLFVNKVCDTLNPYYLDFYDDGWYAEVTCVFEINEEEKTGYLILKNQVNTDKASKWVICGVDPSIFDFPPTRDSLSMITPVSHATGFIALYNTFKDGKNAENYVTRDYAFDAFTYFIYLMYSNNIKVNEISSTRYHFLQVPGWAFLVEYLNRAEKNSGWLITKLFEMSNQEKTTYKNDVLHLYKKN
jgi:hypothetical protein